MRAVIVAAAVAFLISLFGTPIAIRVFSALKAGQPIRSIGPASHMGKSGLQVCSRWLPSHTCIAGLDIGLE